MKFSIGSKTLYGYTSAVSKIINAKNALTILNNFKFSLEGENLRITASDGENFLEARFAVSSADGEGTFCIDAKTLVDLLKDLPDLGIDFEVDPENFMCSITYLNADFQLPGIDGVEYPRPNDADRTTPVIDFTTEASKLLRGIDNTIFAVGNDELRPQMMGILWDIYPEEAVFVATDTRKLVKFSDASIQTGSTAKFIVPLKSMVVFRSVFAKAEHIQVVADEKGVTFVSDDFVFITRFVKGSFPDYNRVIQQNNPYTLTVDRQAFLDTVRRIGRFCDAANGLVRFKIDSTRITFKAAESSLNKRAQESTACDFNGSEMVIGFNAPYVVEILSTLKSKEVVVQLGDPSRPALFLPSENEPDTRLLMLLMPMLVTEF